MNHLSEARDYLVKSAGKVIGPYNVGELVELIYTKKVAAFDEVQGNKRVWRLIKEDPIFKVVLQNAVNQMEMSESTMDVTHAIDLATKTISQISAGFVEDEPSFKDYRNKAEEVTTSTAKVTKRAKPKASYISKNRYTLIYSIVILFSIALLYKIFLLDEIKPQAEPTDVSTADLIYIGDYVKIEERLKNTYKTNSEYGLFYIESLMQQKKYSQAEVVINDLLQTERQSDSLSQLNNWLGVIYLAKQDPINAKLSFEKSLLYYPDYDVARLNMVDTMILLDEIANAKEYLLAEVKMESAASTNAFLSLEVPYLMGNQVFRDTDFFRKIMASYDLVTDQRQELLLLGALILLDNNFKEEAYAMFEEAFSIYPDFYKSNLQSSSLYHPSSVVQKLIVLYKKLDFKFKDDSRYYAALALLHYKNQSPLAFREYYDKAMQLKLEDPNIKSFSKLFSNIVIKDDYNNLIRLGELSPVAANIIGSECYRQADYKCEEVIWNYLLVVRPNSLEAITGMTRHFIRNNKMDMAMSLIHRGLGLAPRYLPIRLLEIRLKYE